MSRPNTAKVLAEVGAHRLEQVARYGENHDLPYATGPQEPWLYPFSTGGATWVEQVFRRDYEASGGDADTTWMRLLREELSEVACEDNPANLRAELVQLAALAVSWIETIDHHAGSEVTGYHEPVVAPI